MERGVETLQATSVAKARSRCWLNGTLRRASLAQDRLRTEVVPFPSRVAKLRSFLSAYAASRRT